MFRSFLLPETIARQNGSGPVVEIGGAAGKTLLLTLGITSVIEQESLDLQVQGSADGVSFAPEPVLAFPQKFYCGSYALLLDLTERPEVRFLRASWKLKRWGRGEPTPLFGFYVFAEETPVAATAVA